MVKRDDKAQAYAMRVWEGQSHTVPRAERIARVHKALEGQGLSVAGIVLPETGPDWQDPDAVSPDYPLAVRGGDPELSDALAYAVEKWANGENLKWSFWLVTLPRLTRAQAVRLLNGLDPLKFADLHAYREPGRYDTESIRNAAAMMEIAASSHGMESASAREWLQWANEHFPGGFRSRFAEKLAELCPIDAAAATGERTAQSHEAKQESKAEARAHRYARFKAIGGGFEEDGKGGWRLTGGVLDRLRAELEANGSKRWTDEKTLSRHLKEEHTRRLGIEREGGDSFTGAEPAPIARNSWPFDPSR